MKRPPFLQCLFSSTRLFVLLLLVVSGTGALSGCASEAQQAEATQSSDERPNFVVVYVDDHEADFVDVSGQHHPRCRVRVDRRERGSLHVS